MWWNQGRNAQHRLVVCSALNALTKMTFLTLVTSLPMNKNEINQKRRLQRRNNLQNLQKNAVEHIAGNLKGKTAAQLVAAYRDPQNTLNADVKSKLALLQGQVNGLTKASIRRLAFTKVHAKNLAGFYEEMAKNNINTEGIDQNILFELVALDDWGSIFRAAMPHIQKYGPIVLNHLYNQYLKPRLDKWMGGDEGINPADWGGVLGPRRFTPVFGENITYPGVKPVYQQTANFNTVCSKSIQSVLCPELFKHRYAYTQIMKTAMATITAEYTVTTSSNGTVGVLFFPVNALASGGGYNASYITVFNDATFNLTTGTQTPSATFRAGPLSASAACIEAYRITNTSIQVIPTASFNTAGSFTLSYKNRSTGNGISANNIGATLVQSKMWPYTTSFNNKTIARMITVSGDSADDEMLAYSGVSFSHTFLLLGSGLPASTECCKLIISSVVEFMPTMDYFPVCVVDMPSPGPLTEQFESMLFARFPVLQQLDLVDSKRIAEALPEGAVPFDEALNVLSSAITGIQPRQYVPHSYAEPLQLQEGSLPELIME